jgi:hypothetical protein
MEAPNFCTALLALFYFFLSRKCEIRFLEKYATMAIQQYTFIETMLLGWMDDTMVSAG